MNSNRPKFWFSGYSDHLKILAQLIVPNDINDSNHSNRDNTMLKSYL